MSCAATGLIIYQAFHTFHGLRTRFFHLIFYFLVHCNYCPNDLSPIISLLVFLVSVIGVDGVWLLIRYHLVAWFAHSFSQIGASNNNTHNYFDLFIIFMWLLVYSTGPYIGKRVEVWVSYYGTQVTHLCDNNIISLAPQICFLLENCWIHMTVLLGELWSPSI